METITEEALIQALLEASIPSEDNPHGALRTAEIVEQSGRSEKWVLAQLRKLSAQGKLGSTQVWEVDITGRMTKRPAYYPKKK